MFRFFLEKDVELPIRVASDGKKIDLYHIDQSEYNAKRFEQANRAEQEVRKLYLVRDSLAIKVAYYTALVKSSRTVSVEALDQKNKKIVYQEMQIKLLKEEKESLRIALGNKKWYEKKIFGVRIDVLSTFVSGITVGVLLNGRI